MKYILFSFIALLIGCVNEKSRSKFESEFDVIDIQENKDHNRMFIYCRKANRNIQFLTFFDKEKCKIGRTINEKVNGRFYSFDTNNIVQSIEYWINDTQVYYLHTKSNYITQRNFHKINSNIISKIEQPILTLKIESDNRCHFFLDGSNYPLLRSIIKLNDSIINNKELIYHKNEDQIEGWINGDLNDFILKIEIFDFESNFLKDFSWKIHNMNGSLAIRRN